MSDEEWESKQLDIYNKDKKEYLAQMGIDYDFIKSGYLKNIEVRGIQVNLYSNDSPDVVAMKVRNAIEGKEYVEGEFTVVDSKPEVEKLEHKE